MNAVGRDSLRWTDWVEVDLRWTDWVEVDQETREGGECQRGEPTRVGGQCGG
jgi:hypothetical protein